MCGRRTSIATLCLTAIVQASVSFGQTPDFKTFATCAGRLSALMEHQWLFSDPLADRTESQRDAMVALTEATASPAEAEAALQWRVAAKIAQAQLLSAAAFSPNETTAARAAQRSQELIGACSALLLG